MLTINIEKRFYDPTFYASYCVDSIYEAIKVMDQYDRQEYRFNIIPENARDYLTIIQLSDRLDLLKVDHILNMSLNI